MGIAQHNVIIATTWDPVQFDAVCVWISRQEWKELFVTAKSIVNDYGTIVLTPDGSNEGRERSNIGDDLRKRFIEQVKNWEFVEVTYGELGTRIV